VSGSFFEKVANIHKDYHEQMAYLENLIKLFRDKIDEINNYTLDLNNQLSIKILS